MCLLLLNCLQLTIILIPQRRILGWHILNPFRGTRRKKTTVKILCVVREIKSPLSNTKVAVPWTGRKRTSSQIYPHNAHPQEPAYLPLPELESLAGLDGLYFTSSGSVKSASHRKDRNTGALFGVIGVFNLTVNLLITLHRGLEIVAWFE